VENIICIDTDVIIDHLKGKGPGVNAFEEIIKSGNPHTTYINKFELLCGARRKKEIKIIETCLLGFRILPFDKSSSREAARIYRELKKQGELIGVRDIMIAGIVKANNLILATKNIKDFKRIKELRLLEIK